MKRLVWLAMLSLGCSGQVDSPVAMPVPGRDDVLVTEYRAHVAGGLSDPVEMNFSDGTGAVVLEISGSRGQYRVAQMVTPDGVDLIENGGWMTRDARERPGLVDWLYPNSPSLKLVPGGYRLRFTALDSTGAPVDDDPTVRVYQRKLPAPEAGGKLHVDLLVADDALAAADVDLVAGQMMSLVSQLYAQVHVTVDDYTSQVVPLGGSDLSLDGGASTALLDVTARAIDHARTGAIRVLLVRSLSDGGNPTAGYALGLPGSVDLTRPTAAVLVATSSFVSPADGSLDVSGLAVTCAHEIGHYLGLYHTVERDGREHDPIADTADDDTSNIMYWTGGSTRHRLSDGQGAVMRLHPLVEATAPVTACDPGCTPPLTCAVAAGATQCLRACDPGDPTTCTDGAECKLSDDGVYVCF
jgi:hypothetical protein